MSFLAGSQDTENCLKELDECLQWVNTVDAKAENADERIAVLSEIENRFNAMETLINKVEQSLDNATENTPHKAEVESKLLQLKQNWRALKMKARKKRRRPGRRGSELESKQVFFVGAVNVLKDWLTEAREKAMGLTAASTMQELQQALNVCTGVRSELLDRKAEFEDVLLKGKEIVAELDDDSLADTESVESQLEELKSLWESVEEDLNKREDLLKDAVEKLEKRVAAKRDFDTDMEAAKEWIEKAKSEITQSDFESGDITALEEHAAKLKNIHDDCQYPSSIVNTLLMKSETALQDTDETEKELLELQLAELKSSVEEALERSRVEIEKLEETIGVNRHFQEACQELKTWVENEESSPEMNSAHSDSSSLETTLEDLKSKQENIDSKEKEIKELAEKAARMTNLGPAGKENIESQLLSLQMSHSALKSKVADKLESMQVESDKVKEFETELQRCREIVQKIENVVTTEPPSFSDIESMEGYVQDLKGKFQDALAQRSAIFQLGEKKERASLVADAEKNYTEVVNQWKTSLACFSEKIAETERRIAEEKELNESFEEVSSWVENTEKELDFSFESEQAQEVEEVVGQVEKLKTLNTECASYEQFVESLRSKVEDSPSKPSEGQGDRLSLLEARVEAMHRRLAAKLGDVEHCVNDVSEVTERISSCKEWLLKKKELVGANEQEIQIGNVPQLEEKLLEFQNLNQEAATVLHDIMQAKDKVGQGVGKVSGVLEESLSKELNSLCDTLMGLHEDSASKSAVLEQCLSEAREFEQELTRYETLLQEADDVLRRSNDKSVGLEALTAKLDELRDLQTELNKKQEEFHCFLETKKDFVAQSGVQERLIKGNKDFENVIKEIPQAMNEIEMKINEYMTCTKELEEALEWLTQSADIIDSNAVYSLDDTSVEEQLAKVKELRPELELFESKLSAIAENIKVVDVVGDDGVSALQEKLGSVRTKWKSLCDDASLNEASLVTFLQAKESYNASAAKCKLAFEDLKKYAEDEDGYSAAPEKYSAQLERRRRQQEKCQELEEQIRAMEKTGDHLADTCEELREPLRKEQIKIKGDWQKMNMEAVIAQEQLAAWISEIGSVREDLNLSLGRVKSIHDSLQNCKSDASDIPSANDVLGQVKQLASELEAEKQNVESVLEKGEMVLEKLDESEKTELEESFRALQNSFNQAEEDSNERVRQAEERISDITEFDKESARCESLLTIYQAAAPVDVSCTVETLEDQMAKLKRLYGDMESRESHMTALQEKEARLSRDDNTQAGRTTPDGKAGKLQGDWGKLKASLGEKLRELERLAQMKKDFEDEYGKCLGGVQELEHAIHEAGSDKESVEARIHEMQELCARIKSYRNKLDLLTDRCDELPNVAYEQKDHDPRKKLIALLRRWEEVKDDALGKLNELEKEKMELEHIAHEISKLQRWAQDACAPIISNDIPSFLQKNELEKALLFNTEFSSVLRTKYDLLNELLVKTRHVKGDGHKKESLMNNLGDVSRILDDAKTKLMSNDVDIKSRLQQHSSLSTDLDHIRDLLVEVKLSQSSEAIELEGDNWIEERIASQRVERAKIESCELLLASVTKKIDEVSPGQSDSSDNVIESDLRALTADFNTMKQQLTTETWQLERLRDFDNECAELLSLYETLTVKVRAVDLHLIAQTANIIHSEEELAQCRSFDQRLLERDGDFEALVEKEKETLSFAPEDKKRELEKRFHQLREDRTALKELIHGRVEGLRSLVAEQQTLEGWLKKAGILIQEAATFLRENEGNFTLDDSRMSDRSQALTALISKLEQYATYSQTFQGSQKTSEVERMNDELIEMRKQLDNAANELQQFKEQCEAFEAEAVEAAKIFERCAADHCAPASLQEAQERLATVKVNKR